MKSEETDDPQPHARGVGGQPTFQLLPWHYLLHDSKCGTRLGGAAGPMWRGAEGESTGGAAEPIRVRPDGNVMEVSEN